MYLEDPAGCAEHGANYAQAVNIPHYGWMAVLFAVLEPKDTAVYKLITTKPGEAASEG